MKKIKAADLKKKLKLKSSLRFCKNYLNLSSHIEMKNRYVHPIFTFPYLVYILELNFKFSLPYQSINIDLIFFE